MDDWIKLPPRARAEVLAIMKREAEALRSLFCGHGELPERRIATDIEIAIRALEEAAP